MKCEGEIKRRKEGGKGSFNFSDIFRHTKVLSVHGCQIVRIYNRVIDMKVFIKLDR